MSADSAAIAKSLNRVDAARRRRYATDLDFYGGLQWVGQGPARRRARRLVLNYVRAVIAKTAAFTLKGMTPLVDPRPDGVSEELAGDIERALRDVYARNAALDFEAEIDCSVLGDGAYRVTWDDGAGRVLVNTPDVQGLFVWPDPRDLKVLWRVAHRYSLTPEELERFVPAAKPAPTAVGGDAGVVQEERRGAAVLGPKRSKHDVVEVWTDEVLDLVVDGVLVEAKANPYGFIPYVLYANVSVPKQFWGESDIEPMRVSAVELNRAFSQLSMILEVSGSPIAVFEGVTKAEDIAVEPGAVWELPEGAKAYLLDLLQGGGMVLHKDYIELLYRTLHDLGEAPRTSFGEADASASSGVALNMLMDPLIKKVERKRLIRADAFRRRDAMVLQLLAQFGGQPAFAGVPTRVQFGEVLPVDRERLAREEDTLVRIGVHSRGRAAGLFGVPDPEAEFTAWLEEQRALGKIPAAPKLPAAGEVVGA